VSGIFWEIRKLCYHDFNQIIWPANIMNLFGVNLSEEASPTPFLTGITGDSWNSPAWRKPCSWNQWTCGFGVALDHPISGNPGHAISLPDRSEMED